MAALPVEGTDEIVVATRQGKVIRTPVEQDESNRISRMGRATQGVRVIRLSDDDSVVSVTRNGDVAAEDGVDGEQPGGDD